eukprot:PhM_4_TR8318/c3_g1_i1/m.77641
MSIRSVSSSTSSSSTSCDEGNKQVEGSNPVVDVGALTPTQQQQLQQRQTLSTSFRSVSTSVSSLPTPPSTSNRRRLHALQSIEAQPPAQNATHKITSSRRRAAPSVSLILPPNINATTSSVLPDVPVFDHLRVKSSFKHGYIGTKDNIIYNTTSATTPSNTPTPTTTALSPPPHSNDGHLQLEAMATSTFVRTPNTYELCSFPLRFRSRETEKAFITFCYFESGFRGGKLIAVGYLLTFLNYIFISLSHSEDSSDVLTHPMTLFNAAIFVLGLVMGILLKQRPALARRQPEVFIFIFYAVAGSALFVGRSIVLDEINQTLIDVFSHGLYTVLFLRTRVLLLAAASSVPSLVMVLYISIVHGPLYSLWVLLVAFPVAVGHILDRQHGARIQFVHIHQSRHRLERIQRHIQHLETTLVSAIPPTAVEHLTSSPGASEVTASYPNTVIIVTDSCGFTAWATRTDQRQVVLTLSVIFKELDGAAEQQGVEMICTVGDSFVGAVFGYGARLEQRALERNVMAGVNFAIDAAQIPQRLELPLRNRVGLDVGPVRAGFVGYSPPVFDVFGSAVTRARELEAAGEPCKVHVSLSALSILTPHCGTPLDAEMTGAERGGGGCLFARWAYATTTLSTPSSSPTPSASEVRTNDESLRRRRCLLRVLRSRATLDNDGNEVPLSESDGESEDRVFDVERHPFSRKFVDASVEQRYTNVFLHRYETETQSALCFVSFVAMFCVCALLVLFVCFGDDFDDGHPRLLLVAALGTLLVYRIVWNIWHDFSSMAALLTTNIALMVCSWALVFLPFSCAADTDQRLVVLAGYNVAAFVRAVVPLFCFVAPRWARIVCLTINTVSVVFVEPLLVLTFVGADEAEELDLSLGAVLTWFVCWVVAYSLDEGLRSAFSAEMTVERELADTSMYMRRVRATLEVMLPHHVIDHIVRQDAARTFFGCVPTNSDKINRLDLDANADDVDDDDAPDETIDRLSLWSYPTLVVGFLDFSLSQSSSDEQLVTVLHEAERVLHGASGNGVSKIKTTGSTMLVIAGDGVSSTSATTGVAVIAMCTFMLSIMSHFKDYCHITSSTSSCCVSARCGIHVGPCFGAVMDTRGLTFDVFGDTVNTASRLCTSAPLGTIRLSHGAFDWMCDTSDGASGSKHYIGNNVCKLWSQINRCNVPDGVVELKGKGMMQVHEIKGEV